MDQWTFTPDEDRPAVEPGDVHVPWFEEATADWAPYYRSGKSESEARAEVANAIGMLGGSGVTFQPGHFGSGDRKRHGYAIRFYYRGAPALIRVAGLPIQKRETDNKVEQVKVQALLNVRDQLLAAARAPVFSPGLDILVGAMLVDEQSGTTIMDMINYQLDSGRLPHLPGPREENEGE